MPVAARLTRDRARATNVPLAPALSGTSRSLAGSSRRRSGLLSQVDVAFCKQVLAPYKRGGYQLYTDAELSIRSAESHRACGNSALEQRSLSGISLLPTDAVGQHFRRDEDRSLRQDREVERIA
jgi:hypothetical protein